MITGVDGIGVTEVRMSETVEKTLAIEAKTLVIVVGIIATAEKIIRIAGGVGVQIIRIPRDTDATTGKISMETGNTRETNEGTGVSEEILRVIKDYGAITKGIFEQIVGLEGTTNDIIRQGQIAGTDPLLNITGINIPADLIKREAGVKLADVRFF